MTIDELKASDVKKCTLDDVGIKLEPKADAPQEVIDECASLKQSIAEYLSDFASPVKRESNGTGFVFGKNNCIACGEPLGGMLGHFKWGLCHGEGFCSCGYPGRALHYIKDSDGKEIFDGPLSFILQYHPSALSESQGKSLQAVNF